MSRLRRTTRQYIVIVLLSLLIIGAAFAAAYFLILRNIESSYGIQIDALSNELEANKRFVYEAAADIEAGTCLTEELLIYKEVYTGQSANTFVDVSDLGKVALITIPMGVYVQKSMLQSDSIEDNIRETAFSCIKLAEHINANDTIDVRLFYPNGEDYIVLSKKVVRACSEDRAQCYLWLNEEELLMMSSAIVDAYLYSGAYLYSTKYVQPILQTASVVNYQASLASQELIQNNPNIIEVAATALSQQLRKAIENRLADSFLTKVDEIHWEESKNTTVEQQKSADSTQGSEQIGEEYFYYSEEVKAKENDVEYGE